MKSGSGRTAIVLMGWEGQPTAAHLEELAARGEHPRVDYVEVVRLLQADLIDSHFIAERGTRLARAVARHVGIQHAQVVELFLRQREYDHILVWSDRLGMAITALSKLTFGRRDWTLLTSYLTGPRRVKLLQAMRLHSHMGAIICDGRKQVELLHERLGVECSKLHLLLQGVDEQFWRPLDVPVENVICSVGQQDRDFPTLVRAVRGLDLRVELVVGGADALVNAPEAIVGAEVPPNIYVRTTCNKLELRHLCARSRFVVVPTQDVDFAAGSTALKEAMAMGKAVIVTESRGQVDYIRDGYNGLYVPPGDSAKLREAIEYLMAHPEEAERMGRAGRAMVAERLSMDVYASEIASVLTGETVPVRRPASQPPGSASFSLGD